VESDCSSNKTCLHLIIPTGPFPFFQESEQAMYTYACTLGAIVSAGVFPVKRTLLLSLLYDELKVEMQN